MIGSCSGGRHTFLVACQTEGIDAAADLWGGGVIMAPDQLSPMKPVSPIDLTANLKAPLIGIFGNDDENPSFEAVNQLEERLKLEGKQYEFHRYEGAGHGFFSYYSPNYRQKQTADGWRRVWTFFEEHLDLNSRSRRGQRDGGLNGLTGGIH